MKEKKLQDGESHEKEHSIHLPDLLFVQYCNHNFGVNRGVYNVVDEYFYKAGVMEILQRRRLILDFLSYLHRVNGIQVNGRINIGGHGLSSRLHEYREEVRNPYLV